MGRHKGFTLVELVVVIMILGILAAVAFPKLVTTTGTATDNGLRQTLSVVRDAIEQYAAYNSGQLPGSDGTDAGFKNDLKTYLRGEFPKCPVGPAKNATVKMSSSDTPITGEAAPTEGWHFNYKAGKGEFIVNYTGVSNDGTTQYDKF